MIKINQLNKYYGALHVLKDVELNIAPQEIVTLLGASGAGKTTLLNIIDTLDRADNGIVEINNGISSPQLLNAKANLVGLQIDLT